MLFKLKNKKDFFRQEEAIESALQVRHKGKALIVRGEKKFVREYFEKE